MIWILLFLVYWSVGIHLFAFDSDMYAQTYYAFTTLEWIVLPVFWVPIVIVTVGIILYHEFIWTEYYRNRPMPVREGSGFNP